METSKDRIYGLLKAATRAHGLSDTKEFQAVYVANELNISRSLASQYLNALYTDGLLVKVTSRPVLFYDKSGLESLYRVSLSETEYISLDELTGTIEQLTHSSYDFEDVIGVDGSLRAVFERVRAAIAYPPKGLPLMLVGSKGTGRSEIRFSINRYGIAEDIVPDEAHVVTIDAKRCPGKVARTLFGDADHTGILRSSTPCLIWVINAQLLDDEQMSLCLSYFESGQKNAESIGASPECSRLFFEFEGSEEDVACRPWFSARSVLCQIPSLSDRSLEEKEAWIFKFFRMEERRIGRSIQVSVTVIRRLTTQRFPDNLDGLSCTVSMAVASALADSDNRHFSELRVFSSHLPHAEGEVLTGYAVYDEPTLIDVNCYDPAQKGSEAVELLTRFMGQFDGLNEEETRMASAEARAKNELSRYFEYVERGRVESPNRDYAAETAFADVVRQVFQRYGVREPVNFSGHFVASIQFFRANQATINRWHASQREIINLYIRYAEQRYDAELGLLWHLKSYLQDFLGWKIDEDNLAIFSFYLHWYLRDIGTHGCQGIIVAHGYSTASSIADSVNSMLGEYVFDAVDMPLDVDADRIVARLQSYLSRFSLSSDLLVMVDMGSLEHIGRELSSSLKVSCGVINNVSTSLALEAGSLISGGTSLSDILEQVQAVSRATYSLSKMEKTSDCIVFSSENGSIAATRLADLFIKSLPRPIPVDMITCDYFELAKNGIGSSELKGYHPLFVFGATDPCIPDIDFLSPEDIAADSNGEDTSWGLDGYLNPSEISKLRDNLVRNFSLESLMSHLTILEPKRLMDVVSSSINLLQENLRQTFAYGMRVRLYIHIGYLVERLVTKEILDYGDAEEFMREHSVFIQLVRVSFAGITANYGVDFPIGEINYLYDIIELECAGVTP